MEANEALHFHVDRAHVRLFTVLAFLFFRAFIVIVSAHEQDSTITAMEGNTARTQHMAATAAAAVKQVIREKKKKA